MITHLLRIIAATAWIILCTVLPFLPGRYDSLAAPLSLASQIFGKVGLLLAPVGAFWVASGYWPRLASKQYGIAIAALIVSMDLLQLTPQELEREQSRGHYAVHDTPFPHWRYFWFD